MKLLLVAVLVWVGVSVSAADVEVIPPELRGAVQPQVAIAGDGSIYVAFGRTGAVYCAVSQDEGRSFKAPVKLGALPKLALGMRRGPRMAATEKGAVVSAISHADGNLVAWVSVDQGATWTGPTRVNTATNSAREGLHAMVSDSRNVLHLAWLDLRSGRTELWGASSKDGGRTWGKNHDIYKSPDGHICECCHPSLTLDRQGRLWAMWRNWLDNARDMYCAVSEDGGVTYAAARKLGTGTWTLKACPMDGGQIAFDADNRLVTVWRREKSLFVSDDRSETALAAQGLHPVVAVGKKGPCYVWQTGSTLMLQKANSEPVRFAEKGSFPAIASSGLKGSPVVVWESTLDGSKTILARRLD